MPSFVDVITGALAKASDVQQIIDALKGTAGKGIPLSLTSVNDAINFALSVKNNDATASKDFIVYKADGTVLFQIDKNGVIASADGITSASQIPTLTGTQTLTNKTLTAPVINGVVTGTTFGAFTAFTPTVTQNGVLTTSTAVGRYLQVGKLVFATVALVLSQAGTAGSAIIVGGLPVAGQSGQGSPCWGFFEHSGGPFYTLAGVWASTTTVQFIASNANAATAPTAFWGTSPGTGLVIGDLIYLTFMYEST